MKKYLALMIVCVALCCTGCVESQYNLTEEENDMIAEYMAGVLLKYDLKYPGKLLYETEDEMEGAESEQVPSPSPIPASSSDKNSPTNSNTNNTTNNGKGNNDTNTPQTEEPATEHYLKLSEIYTSKDFAINFNRSKEYQRYPESSEISYPQLEANKGNKYLVLFFDVKNTASKMMSLNLMSSGIQYRLEDGAGKQKKPLLTALTNDLQYLDVKVEAGKTYEAVIIFEVSKESKMEDFSLYATVGDKTAQVKLK